jgi:hypothetical protein
MLFGYFPNVDAQMKVLHEKVIEMSSRTEEQLCLVRKAQELAENEKLIQESLKVRCCVLRNSV